MITKMCDKCHGLVTKGGSWARGRLEAAFLRPPTKTMRDIKRPKCLIHQERRPSVPYTRINIRAESEAQQRMNARFLCVCLTVRSWLVVASAGPCANSCKTPKWSLGCDVRHHHPPSKDSRCLPMTKCLRFRLVRLPSRRNLLRGRSNDHSGAGAPRLSP